MPKSDGENKESYYSKLKAENEELKNEITWFDNRFLLYSDLDEVTMYGYLKNNPGASEFIYQKYTKLRPLIAELCDPKNPLYLPDVAENLKEIVTLERAKEDLKSIQDRIGFLGSERDKLQATVDEKVKEYENIEEKISIIRKEEESINRQKANIRTDYGLEKINSLFDSLLKITQATTPIIRRITMKL